MKILRRLIFIAALMIVFMITPKAFGYNRWNSLNIDAEVMLNGDMEVVETWDIYISETNTLFKNFDVDKEKFSEITNVRVYRVEGGYETPLRQIYEEQYHVDSGCYYALPIKNGRKFEIAWNVGLDDSSATRTYKIYYTVKDAVKVYKDCTEIYWQFVGAENEIKADQVVGTIKLPYNSLDLEKVRVWAHGPLDGEITKASNREVNFNVPGLSTKTMVEIRVVTDENIYSTWNTIPVNKLDDILKEETEWADEANRKRERSEKIAIVALLVLFGANIGLGIIFIKKMFTYIREGKETPKYEKFTSDLKYFRDIPNEKEATPARCSYIYNFRTDTSYIEMTNVFPAIMLDLATKGYLEFRMLEKNNIEIEIKKKDMSELPDDERHLFELILRYAEKVGQDTITSKDFTKYAKKEYELFHTKATKTKDDVEKYYKERKIIDEEKETIYKKWNSRVNNNFIALFCTIFFLPIFFFLPVLGILLINLIIAMVNRGKIKTILSERGYEEKTEWQGLKNFLNDYSLMKDRNAPDIILWEKYLVYATVFGISEKVLKQLKVDYPQFFDGSYTGYMNRYSYFSIMNNSNFSSDAFRDFSRSLSSPFTTATNAYNSAHYSSGSGGGGGFSGGGGGRRRRRWLWRKIK